MDTPKKVGRPAKLGQAMPDKQRAAAYRARQSKNASVAHENLSEATTLVLLAALAKQLKATADAGHADTARDIASQVIKELCERHRIQLM